MRHAKRGTVLCVAIAWIGLGGGFGPRLPPLLRLQQESRRGTCYYSQLVPGSRQGCAGSVFVLFVDGACAGAAPEREVSLPTLLVLLWSLLGRIDELVLGVTDPVLQNVHPPSRLQFVFGSFLSLSFRRELGA